MSPTRFAATRLANTDRWKRGGLPCGTQQDTRSVYEFSDQGIVSDPWIAVETNTILTDAGFTTVTIRQGFDTLSAPTKRLFELVISKELAHGKNPILTWMAGHVVVRTDPNGLQRPHKAKSNQRIDGIVSFIMALARAMVVPLEQHRGILYRGLRSI